MDDLEKKIKEVEDLPNKQIKVKDLSLAVLALWRCLL